MSGTAVAVDFNQTLNVEGNLTAEFTFYLVICFDFLTKLRDFIFSQIFSACVRIDTCLSKNVLCAL